MGVGSWGVGGDAKICISRSEMIRLSKKYNLYDLCPWILPNTNQQMYNNIYIYTIFKRYDLLIILKHFIFSLHHSTDSDSLTLHDSSCYSNTRECRSSHTLTLTCWNKTCCAGCMAELELYTTYWPQWHCISAMLHAQQLEQICLLKGQVQG